MVGTFKSGRGRKGSKDARPLNEDRDPWERQRGEGHKAYAAFHIYCQMGTKRSTKAAARELKKNHTHIQRWCTLWRWVERADAWLDHEAKVARDQRVKDIEEMERRHINISMTLQAVGGQALTAMNNRAKKILAADPTAESTDLTPNEARQMVESGMRYERLTRGEPTEIGDVVVQDARDVIQGARRILSGKPSDD